LTSCGTLRGKRAVLVGDAEELASFTARDLRQLYAIEQVARFALHGPSVAARVTNDIVFASRAYRAEQVVLALPWNDTRRIQMLLEQLRVLPLSVVLVPDRCARVLVKETSQRDTTAIVIELQRAPLTYGEAAMKRTFDIIVGGAILFSLLPVLILAGIAIVVDSPGPVIFRQRRRGFNGSEFNIKKFRSMTVLDDGPIIIQARPNDARVTRVGRILRRTSIDELPQLLNVLRGEMSLVGPRPHAIAHDAKYGDLISHYAVRHRIKPGITGWAQINGLRGETSQVGSMERRIDLDLWYINNWSIWLDVKILVLTLREIMRGCHAF